MPVKVVVPRRMYAPRIMYGHERTGYRVTTLVVVVDNAPPRSRLRRNLLLTAVTDEVDQAIAGLQTARQLLVELQRVSELTERSGRLGLRDLGASQPARPSSLRYSGVTVAEASRILDLSEEHVRRLLRRGELEGIAFGGRVGWRMSREYVEDLAAQQRAARQGQVSARRDRPQPQGPRGRRTSRR
jgi:excisionase family DNA binding protein